MAWRDYYRGLFVQEREPVVDLVTQFSNGLVLMGHLATPDMFDGDGQMLPKKFDPDSCFSLVLLGFSIFEDRDRTGVRMTLQTTGQLPEGMLHGTYALDMDSSGWSDDLPAEMFEEDAEVHEELLSPEE